MTWSIPIFSWRGTAVRLHVTFLLFLLWIGLADDARGGLPAAFSGVALLVMLFACVVAHEFGHVVVARRFGITTPDITLLPIGGVARLERLPEKPSQELLVALAGPAVNVAIAGVLALVLAFGFGARLSLQGLAAADASHGFLAPLLTINLFLAAFNLLPAFPMDGGRVLRAALAWRMGTARATRVAATVGQVLAIALGVLGLFGHPLLLFVAVFVFLGAASEGHAVQMREASRGATAGDAMVTRFEALSPQSSVDDAVQHLVRNAQHEFPVVDGAGRLRGVLTRNAMIRALRDRGPDTPVLDIMHADIPAVRARAPLSEALRLMRAGGRPAVGVTDADGRLLGLVTPEHLGEFMMVHALSERWPQPQRFGGDPYRG